MKAHTAESYYTHHHEDCIKHLKRYQRRATADDLHAIRVSIKKIKAMINMAGDLNALDVEAYLPVYRSLFQQAGAIREATITTDKLKLLSKDKKAITFRRKGIEALNKKFKSEIPLHIRDLKKMVEDLTAALLAYEHDIPGYCSQLRKKLKKRWRKSGKSGHYHTLRKHLKQVIYCSSLLPSSERKKVIPASHLKLLNKLQDLIGEWHDSTSMVYGIYSDVKDAPAVESTLRKDIRRIEKKIIRTGDKMWG